MNGPLIVQSDKTLLLEVDHEQAGDCRRAIAPFAELERAPEHIHTYRVTPLGLWNARAAGHDAEQVVDALVEYSRYPVPHALLVDIAETMDRYGRLTLSKHPAHGLVLSTTDRPVLEEVLKSKRIAPLVGARIDADTVAVHPSERGQIKQTLLKLGWPAEDLAGYVDGEAHPIELAEDGWALRPYQKQAVENFWHGGSGVVVLPCGAGKTLVGAGAMAQARSTTLILVTNTVSARQWKHELVKRTSLTEDEIGEYSGTRKEIRPVTIATYQVLTTRRKGVYPHLELFDSRDWGLIVYDEVHLLPAPVFKFTADLQARRRLGLTATLVREDGRESDVFSLIGPKRFDAPWKEIEAQGYIAPADCVEVRVNLTDSERLAYATARDGGEVPLLRDDRHQAEGDGGDRAAVRRAADPRHRPVHRPARRAGRAPGRAGHQGRDVQRPAGEALRVLPAGRDQRARRVEGRELLDRPAGGDGRHPGVRHLRLAAGGGPAPGPGAAPQGRRPPGALLLGRRPRHPRPGLRRPPPALPGGTGLRLPDHGRGRGAGGRKLRPPSSVAADSGLLAVLAEDDDVEGGAREHPDGAQGVTEPVPVAAGHGRGTGRAARCRGGGDGCCAHVSMVRPPAPDRHRSADPTSVLLRYDRGRSASPGADDVIP
ncbi:hypothetical protein RKD37_005147 [Streptomyces ambofaciens]